MQEKAMEFTPVTIEALDTLTHFAKMQPTRSCDYTPDNLIHWAPFMQYRYAVEQDTLFIKCLSQNDLEQSAYLAPIGALPLKESIALLEKHCNEAGEKLQLTAVPEPIAEEIKTILPSHTAELLEGWSDYIYSAESLATLKGKSLNKKRNRYNKFVSTYPEYEYSRCTPADAAALVAFIRREKCTDPETMRCRERHICIKSILNLGKYPRLAGIIRIDGNIEAFSIGEIFGDTLYVHMEKASHEFPGLSEAINRHFANDIFTNFNIQYINREEDMGNEGLRQAKRAYSPIEMLHRYEFYLR